MERLTEYLEELVEQDSDAGHDVEYSVSDISVKANLRVQAES